jgi:serine/threonine protein kinase
VLTNSNELIGRALGTCTLKRLIGRGGMGAVYLAQQSRPRRTVAVKVLLPHLVEIRPREEFLARFRREADAIAALDHINIMPIYEYGEQGEAAYLVMPYVMGGTLRERLEVQPIPPIQDIVAVIEQVAAGLDCAHALGIIHRDLKPGNILFHADGRVLITDFGLAKMLKDVKDQESGANALTSAGSIIGTPEYLSPEQGTGNPTDYHTDIYSLGVVLYQMLAGRVPFVGTTPVAVAIKHALQEPPLLTDFNPAIPSSVQAVTMKALAKAPEQRFTSAGELARALRLAISNESVTTIWSVPATNVPLVTAVPTADEASRPVEQVEDHVAQENTLELSGSVEESTQENKDDNAQGLENQASVEPAHVDQEPQEKALQEKVTNLPTLLMKPDADELHDSPTIEGPPTGTQDEAKQSFANASTLEDKLEPKAFHQQAAVPAFLPETEKPQHSPALGRDRMERVIQNQRVDGGLAPVLRTPVVPAQSTSFRFQSIRMILLVSLLVLLIVGGGFATYQHLLPNQLGSSTTKSEATATAISQVGKTPSPQDQTPVATSPPVAISAAIPAGRQIYGTSSPFSACDKQGGHWTKTSDARVTCNSDGSKMVNTSGHLVVANLDRLLGNQSPSSNQNFIVQVQVTINSDSHGAFGIDFLPQTGDNSGGYFAYLLDQSGGRTFNHYDDQGNVRDTLLPSGQPPTSVSTNTKLTLDIRVTGTGYAFYINGNDTIDRAETGSQYANRIIGLAVGPQADVTFSNFAIYALP